MMRPIFRLLLLAACAAAVYAAAGAWRWVEAERLNHLIAERSTTLADAASPYAMFAEAARQGEANRMLESLAAYRRAAETGPRGLAVAAWYNSGNLHLRQAETLGAAADANIDQVRAAAELAKECYRRALRLQPDYWPARYNLEKALGRFPEADDEELGGPPPAKRERAVTTMQGNFQGLP